MLFYFQVCVYVGKMEIDMQTVVNEVVATESHTHVNNVVEETIKDEDNVDFIPAEGMNLIQLIT